MKLLLAALLAASLPNPECAAALSFRGVGTVAARQAEPYATCLNSAIGTAEQLRARCREARAKAADYHGPRAFQPDVDRAIRWLDAMVQQRAACETELNIEA